MKPVALADLREMLETIRRAPPGVWTGTILTRHVLMEARRGGDLQEAELEESLSGLVNGER